MIEPKIFIFWRSVISHITKVKPYFQTATQARHVIIIFPFFFPGAVDAHNYGKKLVACEKALVEPMTT